MTVLFIKYAYHLVIKPVSLFVTHVLISRRNFAFLSRACDFPVPSAFEPSTLKENIQNIISKIGFLIAM